MPTGVYVPTGDALEGNDVWIVQRVVMADGTYLDTAGVDNDIIVKVYDLTLRQNPSGMEPIWKKTDLSPGDGTTGPLFNTLQTDGYWDGLDEDGYNWRYQLQYDSAGSAGPNMIGGRRYLVEFEADVGGSSTPDTDYGTVRWAAILQIHNYLGS